VGDVEDMTRKALFILDKNNLPRFKENALKRAQEFDITRVMPLYENFYKEVMEKAKKEVKLSTR
jgi:L-malate glycosyltransferase